MPPTCTRDTIFIIYSSSSLLPACSTNSFAPFWNTVINMKLYCEKLKKNPNIFFQSLFPHQSIPLLCFKAKFYKNIVSAHQLHILSFDSLLHLFISIRVSSSVYYQHGSCQGLKVTRLTPLLNSQPHIT